MTAPVTLSPIHDALLARNPLSVDASVMPPVVLGVDGDDAQRAAVVGIADLSHLPRFGAKGPGAAGWLTALGLPVPAQPNSWSTLAVGRTIGMAFVTPELAAVGSSISIRLSDGSEVQATVARTPFYDPDNLKQKEAA